MSGALQAVFQNLRSFAFGYWAQVVYISGINAGVSVGAICADSSGNTYTTLPVQNALLFKLDDKGSYTYLSYYGNVSSTCLPRAITYSGSNIYTIRTSGLSNYPIISKYNTSGSLSYAVFSSNLGLTNCMASSSDGNFFIGGRSGVIAFIYKSSSTDGSMLSGSYISVSGSDSSSAGVTQAIQDSSGNVYVAGTMYNGSGYISFIVKYNSSFTVQWQRTLPQGSRDNTGAVSVDSSGDVYFAASVAISGSGYVIRLIKFNSSGTVQWKRDISTSGGVTTNFISIGTDGYLYLVGNSISNTAITFVAKYDSSGNIQWQRTVSWQVLTGACLDSDNNILFAAFAASTTPSSYAIFKLSSSGQAAGTYSINGITATIAASSYTDAASSVTVTNSSLTTGSISYSTGTLSDMATLSAPTVTTALTGL
jgi:hypothetical protein